MMQSVKVNACIEDQKSQKTAKRVSFDLNSNTSETLANDSLNNNVVKVSGEEDTYEISQNKCDKNSDNDVNVCLAQTGDIATKNAKLKSEFLRSIDHGDPQNRLLESQSKIAKLQQSLPTKLSDATVESLKNKYSPANFGYPKTFLKSLEDNKIPPSCKIPSLVLPSKSAIDKPETTIESIKSPPPVAPRPGRSSITDDSKVSRVASVNIKPPIKPKPPLRSVSLIKPKKTYKTELYVTQSTPLQKPCEIFSENQTETAEKNIVATNTKFISSKLFSSELPKNTDGLLSELESNCINKSSDTLTESDSTESVASQTNLNVLVDNSTNESTDTFDYLSNQDDMDDQKKSTKKRSNSFRKIFNFGSSKDKKKDETKEKNIKVKKKDSVLSENAQNENIFDRNMPQRHTIGHYQYRGWDDGFPKENIKYVKNNGGDPKENVANDHQDNVRVDGPSISHDKTLNSSISPRQAVKFEYHYSNQCDQSNPVYTNHNKPDPSGYVCMGPAEKRSDLTQPGFVHAHNVSKYIDTTSSSSISTLESDKNNLYENSSKIRPGKQDNRSTTKIPLPDKKGETPVQGEKCYERPKFTNSPEIFTNTPRRGQSCPLIKPKAVIPINTARPLPNYRPIQIQGNGSIPSISIDKRMDNNSMYGKPNPALQVSSNNQNQENISNNSVNCQNIDEEDLYGTVYDSLIPVGAQLKITNTATSNRDSNILRSRSISPSQRQRTDIPVRITSPPMSPLPRKELEPKKLRLPANRDKAEPRIKSPVDKTKLTPPPKNKKISKDAPTHQNLEIEIDYPNPNINQVKNNKETPRKVVFPEDIREESKNAIQLKRSPHVSPVRPKSVSQGNLTSVRSPVTIRTESPISLSSSCSYSAPYLSPKTENLNDLKNTEIYFWEQSNKVSPVKNKEPAREIEIQQSDKFKQKTTNIPQKNQNMQNVEAFYWQQLKKLMEKKEQELYNQQVQVASRHNSRSRSLSPGMMPKERRSLSLPRDIVPVVTRRTGDLYGYTRSSQTIPEGRVQDAPAMEKIPEYGMLNRNFVRGSPQRSTIGPINMQKNPPAEPRPNSIIYENYFPGVELRHQAKSAYNPIFKRGSLSNSTQGEISPQGSKKVSFSSEQPNEPQAWPTKNGYTLSPPTRRVEKRPESGDDEVFLPNTPAERKPQTGNNRVMQNCPDNAIGNGVSYEEKQIFQLDNLQHNTLPINHSHDGLSNIVEQPSYKKSLDSNIPRLAYVLSDPQIQHSLNRSPATDRPPGKPPQDSRNVPPQDIGIRIVSSNRNSSNRNYLQGDTKESMLLNRQMQQLALQKEPTYGQTKQVTVRNKVCDIYGQIHDTNNIYGNIQRTGVIYGQLQPNPVPGSPIVVRQQAPPQPFVRGTRLTASFGDMRNVPDGPRRPLPPLPPQKLYGKIGLPIAESESGSEAGEVQRIMSARRRLNEEDWNSDGKGGRIQSIDSGGSGRDDGEIRGRGRSSRREDPRRHTLSGDQHYPGMSQQGGSLARTMDLEAPLPRGYPPPGSAILFDDDPGIMSEVETSSTGFRRGGKQRSSLPVVRTPSKTLERPLGLVFLQYRNETKRALLPNEITSIDTVKALFVRSFPKQLTMEYLDSPLVKIYIHDSSKDMFYELEDLRSHLRDIRDRSVLRLFESADISGGLPGPGTGISGGVGHFEDQSYFSEPEFDSEYQHQHIHKSKTSTAKAAPPYYMSSTTIPRGGPLLRAYSPAIGGPIPAERLKSLPTGVPPKPIRTYASNPPGGIRSNYNVYQTQQGVRSRNGIPPSTADRIHTDGYMSSPERGSRSGYEDPYYSQYTTRSGSITPVIDEEARIRVENMERQLANLTGLVQKALHQNPPAPRDFLQVPGSRDNYRTGDEYDKNSSSSSASLPDKSVSFEKSVSFSDEPPDMNSPKQHSPQHSERDRLKPAPPPKPASLSPAQYDNSRHIYRDLQLTPEMYNQLRGLQKKAKDLRTEVRNLRRLSQAQAHSVRETIRDTFIKIRAMLLASGEQVWQAGIDQEKIRLSREEDLYKQEMIRLEKDLTELESTVEELRGNVINRKTRVNMSDVENMALVLSKSSKTVADLKLRFPGLQDAMKSLLSTEMEKVVREEKFLKEEPERLESALRRCKKLTGTLVTLKRLASVQEQRLPCTNNTSDGRLSPNLTETPPVTPPSAQHSKTTSVSPARSVLGQNTVGGDSSSSDCSQRPENALDALLDELQTFSKPHSNTVTTQLPQGASYPQEPAPVVPAKGVTPSMADIGRKGSMDSATMLPSQTLTVSTATGSLRRLHSYPSGSDTDNSPPIQPLQRSSLDGKAMANKPPIPERNAELLQHIASGRRVPPPPPPRTSSKSPLASPTSPSLPPRSSNQQNVLQHIQNVQSMEKPAQSQFEAATQNLGLGTLRRNVPGRSSLKEKSQTLPRNIGSNLQVHGSAGEPDKPSISASNSSSCESVNSQEGAKKGSRKEELEQRHQELLKKQKALQEQYARLQQLQRGNNTLTVVPPAPDLLLKKTGSESNLLQKMGLQMTAPQMTGSLTHLANTGLSVGAGNGQPAKATNEPMNPAAANTTTTNKIYETDIL